MTAGAGTVCVDYVKNVSQWSEKVLCAGRYVRLCVQGADAEALLGKNGHSLSYALFPFIHPSRIYVGR